MKGLRNLLTETGNMFAITLEAFRIMWKPPYPWREFIRQSWFIASVSMIPAVLVAMLLDGFVSVAGIAGGYFFNVIIQGGTPGAYLASFSLLAQTADLF